MSTVPIFQMGTLRHYRRELTCPVKSSQEFLLSRNECISYPIELRGESDFQKTEKNILIVSFQNACAGSLRYQLLLGILFYTKLNIKPEDL